jgi:sugar phosphate isomerase/epimerase
MDIGLCTISAKDRPVDEILDVAAEAGADGVEIWGGEHVGDGSRAACERIASAAAERGLSIPVYGSYLRPGTDGVDGAMASELKTASALGADLIRVWAGDREHQDCSESHWEAVVADLGRLADAAVERDLAVTVERHAGTVTNTTEGAADLVAAVDHPAVGLNWQPNFEHDAAAVRADAADLAALANNVHLQAVPESGATDRCALADAYFDVAAVAAAFADAGFEGFLEVEFVTEAAPYEAAVAADVAFLDALPL